MFTFNYTEEVLERVVNVLEVGAEDEEVLVIHSDGSYGIIPKYQKGINEQAMRYIDLFTNVEGEEVEWEYDLKFYSEGIIGKEDLNQLIREYLVENDNY